MPLRHLWREAFSDVQRWAQDAGTHSLLLDFDGTLTPIVPDPDDAFLSASLRHVLFDIQDSGKFAVGVISGRALNELRTRVGINEIVYAGNHGMEIAGPDYRFIDSVALSAEEEIRSLAYRIAHDLKESRLRVENKKLSITIH